MSKFSDHFNSTTIRGRANVAKVTYASFAAIYLYNRFRKSKKKTTQDSQINEQNLNDQFAKSEDNDSNVEPFKCPHCECNKNNNNSTDNEHQDLTLYRESKTTTENSSSDKSEQTPNDKAESLLKSSKTKCESGCFTSSSSNPSEITNEQIFLKSAEDDKDLFWCYST